MKGGNKTWRIKLEFHQILCVNVQISIESEGRNHYVDYTNKKVTQNSKYNLLYLYGSRTAGGLGEKYNNI